MTTITPDQKREFREARQAAIEAVARLNELFRETARTYRAEFHMVPYWPDDALADDDDDDAADEQLSGTGREGAERENEGSDL